MLVETIDLIEIVKSSNKKTVELRDAIVGVLRDLLYETSSLRTRLRCQSKREAPWVRKYIAKRTAYRHRPFHLSVQRKNGITVRGSSYQRRYIEGTLPFRTRRGY
ncbi:hypothetical protein [Pseudomonas phage vB_PaeM_PS119XW]|uniref:Uncharacterized protein n=1 Tax=Pseudomonas phage vB_PaeM_PS119XW TaxID=2601632 RepID=A0A5C1K7W5_9CAUD|nr:hypothetical protein PP933_gp241 [Pseudomonas phage vB_PaeM_PS119XW]QEM41970.1 hypothetical protein [Pseudomonas phage vB_PaeM_PS119XW]